MSPIEHYFENLLMFGHDVNDEPNKNKLTVELQEAIEMCAEYIRYDRLLESTVLQDIKKEIENEYTRNIKGSYDGCDAYVRFYKKGLKKALNIICDYCCKENKNDSKN